MDTWKQTLIFHYIKTHLLHNNVPSVIHSNLFYLNIPFNLLYIKEGCFSFSTVDIRGWTVLCCVHMVECLAASLASTHEIPVAPPPQVWWTKTSPDIAKCLQLRTIKELLILTVCMQQCWKSLGSEVFNIEIWHFLWNFDMIAVPHEKSIFRFIINWHTVFENDDHFTVPLAECESSCCPTAGLEFGAVRVPDVSCLDSCAVVCHCCFNFHVSDNIWHEHHFVCSFSICMSLVRCLLRSLSHLLSHYSWISYC